LTRRSPNAAPERASRARQQPRRRQILPQTGKYQRPEDCLPQVHPSGRSSTTTQLTRRRKRQSEARHERNGGAVGGRVQRIVGPLLFF